MPYSESPRPLMRAVASEPPLLQGRGGPSSGACALRQITVAVTAGFCDYGSALVVMCQTLEDRPRALQAALSRDRAALWRATTGQQILALLEQRRASGQEVLQDMPLFPLRLEGVEREREFASPLGRRYRVQVFEVARWSAFGGTAMRDRLWH